MAKGNIGGNMDEELKLQSAEEIEGDSEVIQLFEEIARFIKAHE